MQRPLLVAVLLGLGLAGCQRAPSAGDAGTGQAPVDARAAARAAKAASAEAQRLREITEAWYEQYLQLNPLAATARGDHRYDDRFGDYVSERWMADMLAMEQEALEKLRTVDPARLSGEDLLTYESFRYGREIAIEGFRYPSELLPFSQFAGLHTHFAVLGSGNGAHPFRTAQDYDNFLGRMDGFVAWADQSIANMRSGAERGLVQPRVIVERLIPQLDALAVTDPRQSVFWQPIERFPAAMQPASYRPTPPPTSPDSG